MNNYLPLKLTTKYDREKIIIESHKILFQEHLMCSLKGFFFHKYLEIATEKSYKTVFNT